MSSDPETKPELRQLPSGGSVTTEMLQSFLSAQLRHDVLVDQVLELVVAEVRGGTVDREALADNLAALVAEVSEVADAADWRTVADSVVADARSLLKEEDGGGNHVAPQEVG